MGMTRIAVLLAGMTGLFLAAGFMMGGEAGMIIALGIAVCMNAFAYWNSDKMVLRMHGAREVDQHSAPALYGMVARLAQRAELPMPKVYIMDTPQPNAFATGRNPENAAVAATTGLLNMMNDEEVAGVMAHELAHVKNRDTLIMTITATLAGALSMLANFGLFFGGNRNSPLGMIGTIAMMILAPMAAMVVQMAISRTAEYRADKLGAEICGQPLWLASALAKLENGSKRIDNMAAERNPATAHMFIVNPLHAQAVDGLFKTHPHTQNRIAALQKQAAEMTRRPSGPSNTGPVTRFTSNTSNSGTSSAPTRRSSIPQTGQTPTDKRGPWG